jgi:hypothetical protein
MGSSASAPAVRGLAKAHGHSVGFNLAVIAIVVAIGGLGLAYLIDAAGRAAKGPAPVGVVTRTLGSVTLNIPAIWLAPGEEQQSAGFVKQVDLVVTLPLGPKGAMRKVDVTLTQRSRVRPSASLLDGVYLHEFQTEQLSGPPGLVGKPMSAADGYANETVWYDPINSSPFVAKCDAPIVEDKPGRCLRAVYLGPGMAAVYGFDEDVLDNWRKFDASLHPMLTEIGAL